MVLARKKDPRLILEPGIWTRPGCWSWPSLDLSPPPPAGEEGPLEAPYGKHVFTRFGFTGAKKNVDFRPCFKGKVWSGALTLNFVVEPRVLCLPPSQSQPLLNLYRRGPLVRNVCLAPRLNVLFCCHHCAQGAVGYYVGISTAPEPEHRMFGQIYVPRENGSQFLRPNFPFSQERAPSALEKAPPQTVYQHQQQRGSAPPRARIQQRRRLGPQSPCYQWLRCLPPSCSQSPFLPLSPLFSLFSCTRFDGFALYYKAF